MKIVEQHTLEEFSFTYAFTCGQCRSKLEAEVSDIGYGDFGCGYADDHEYRYYVTCPVCSQVKKLQLADVPSQVRELILRKET